MSRNERKEVPKGNEDTERAIRVAFFDPFGVAGLTHYTYALAQALASIGVRPTLVTSQNYELDRLSHGFRVERILPMWNPFAPSTSPRPLALMEKAGRYLLSLALATAYMIQSKPDICHIMEMHFSFDISFLLALKLRGIRLVGTCHNVQRFNIRRDSPRLLGRGKLGNVLQSLMYRSLDGLVFHAPEHRNEFQRVFRFLPPHHRVIPQGEYSFIAALGKNSKAEARNRLKIPPGAKLILFFGVLRKYKGLDTLIRGFPEVKKVIPSAWLLIAGAPFRDINLDALKKLAAGTGSEEEIVWHSRYIPLQEVPDYFTACDVVALPYSQIYQSGVLQLAQAFAKPVVATRVGALSGTLRAAQAAYLVPPGDPRALAEALVQMLSRPKQAKRIGEEGRESSRTNYSWIPIAQKTEELYREILERR